MKNKIFILIGVVVIILIAWMLIGRKGAVSQTAGAALGERCGGNMTNAPACASGSHCAPEPGSHLPFGDVGGICVNN